MPFITYERLQGLERARRERDWLHGKGSHREAERLTNLTRLVPALEVYQDVRRRHVVGGEVCMETIWNDKLIDDTIAALDRQKQADQDAKLIAGLSPAPEPERVGGYTGSKGSATYGWAEPLEGCIFPTPKAPVAQVVELSAYDRELLREAGNLSVTIPGVSIANAIKTDVAAAPKRDAALREHAATIMPALADDEAWKHHAEWVIRHRIPVESSLESAKSRLSDFADGFQAGRAAGRAGKKAAK